MPPIDETTTNRAYPKPNAANTLAYDVAKLRTALDSIDADTTGLFNNMAQPHSTRTAFDATTPSYGFGYRYVQGATNGPGSGGAQFYSGYLGLGSEYPATGVGSYGMYFAIDRNVANPYLSIRYNEANVLSTWRKISAGKADTWTTGRTISLTGDVTYTSGSLDGSANVTGTATLANSGVTAGSYTNTNITVDAKGRITAAASGSPGGVTSFSAGTTGLTPSTATTGAVTLAGTLAVANGGTGVTTSTGTGSTVRSTSPSLTTPILGTPTSGTLTNCTGYTFANIASKPTTRDGYGITDVPKTDGTSASGTWGINVTGNAATATTLQTARTVNNVSFNGSSNIVVPTLFDSSNYMFTNPGGGQSVSGTATVTGAIAITFPVGMTNTMLRLTIKVYEYTTNEAFEIHCGGYNYAPTLSWVNNPYAYIIGNPNTDRRFTVRFGYTAAGRAIIYIGELASTWSYPQVYITEVQCGYSGYTNSFASGWAISYVTAAFESVTATITNPQVGYQSSSNTANSVVLRDASGNFSANVISLTGNGSTLYGPNTTWGASLRIGGNGNADTANASVVTTNGNLHIDSAPTFATYLNYYKGTGGIAFGSGASAVVAFMGPDGDLWKGPSDNSGSVYWHAGNDGAGSGLDADLLDGLASTSFLRSDANSSFTGQITMSIQNALVPSNYGHGVYGLYSPTNYQHVWGMGTAYSLAANGTTPGNFYGLAWSYNPDYLAVGNNAQAKAGLNHQLLLMMNGITNTAIGNGIWTSGNATIVGSATIAGSTAWHAGNDGTGSGLDADLWDGYQLSTQGNWSTNSAINIVTGLLGWKNYGNSHVIFDASAGTSPSGGAVNNTNAAVAWSATYPTLMGWNGASTYGVRVDSARVADSASSSASCTGNAATASGLPTYYIGGQQTNPQTYFGQSIGLRVAMTGFPSVWADTLWINGYAGGDVLQMCALHTLRNGTPRMFISAQASNATSYGTTYEFLTAYNYTSYTPKAGAGGAIIENINTISADYTITTGSNGISSGPITIANGVTVTVPSNSTWTIV